MTRRSWVQDPETGKLIPKEEWREPVSEGAAILGDIEPFISPVTGQAITSRSGLRAHNNRHGVTDSRDYSHEFLLGRSRGRISEMTGQSSKDKQDRINSIRQELDKHGR